jgi:DNA-directed RNA polymerase subunit H (RpoH/RPB5)
MAETSQSSSPGLVKTASRRRWENVSQLRSLFTVKINQIKLVKMLGYELRSDEELMIQDRSFEDQERFFTEVFSRTYLQERWSAKITAIMAKAPPGTPYPEISQRYLVSTDYLNLFNGNRLRVTYLDDDKSKSVGIKPSRINTQLLDLLGGSITHLMLILPKPLAESEKKKIEESDVQCTILEDWQLNVSPTEHSLNQSYSKLSPSMVNSLLESIHVPKKKLPRMLTTDPNAVAHGWVEGDVIMIIRHDFLTGGPEFAIYWRVITRPPIEKTKPKAKDIK